jgi:hypothetical protein
MLVKNSTNIAYFEIRRNLIRLFEKPDIRMPKTLDRGSRVNDQPSDLKS